MAISVEVLRELCPDVDAAAVEAHARRLEEGYESRFDVHAVARHLQALAQLSATEPVRLLLTHEPPDTAVLTVLAFDHPFEFSLICGILAGSGFTIIRGDVFTLKGVAKARRGSGRPRRRLIPVVRSGLEQPVIIDQFVGRLADGSGGFEPWSQQVRRQFESVIGLLDAGDEASVEKVKHQVNELVTRRLADVGPAPGDIMLPVRVEAEPIDEAGDGRTRLNIYAQDTPAFLYSLGTALSLQGLSIERVRIQTYDGGIEDQVDVVDRRGQPLTDPNDLERVKLSVLLTKQFTYFLEGAPDRYAALKRFEELCGGVLALPESGRWRELLSDPHTLQELAKLLGTSDYLWEDFIRSHYETLLPMLAPHIEGKHFSAAAQTLPLRMEASLEGAADLDEKQCCLNAFKDREIFLVDLDHILTEGFGFRNLSERLTALAENLVTMTVAIVHADLVARYGEPTDAGGRPCRHAVFGLGKLGGVALGYASDIELLFVYDGAGRTKGGGHEPISNAEFHERLARQASKFIKTSREGIFQVDLRLRPYGTDGPLACSLEQYRHYYLGPEDAGATRPTHPFELLALVRLRWIAGSPGLGYEVERLRDRAVFDAERLDTDALWQLWNRRLREKAGPRPNAKHSPGGLANLEGIVQLLQVTHASRAPQLRTARLSSSMDALRRAGVLNAREYADFVTAYYFYRRLINGLRMLRGDATDLFLPLADSDELLHLSRRMRRADGEVYAGPDLLEAVESSMAMVCRFAESRFGKTLGEASHGLPASAALGG